MAYFDGNSLPDALRAAKSADLAIAVVGNHPTCNNTPQQVLATLMGTKSCADPTKGMEGSDRKSIELQQEALVKQVYAANPKTVVVLVASSPYAINWTQQNVPAILHMSHSGQEEGNALVDVLFSDYNPSGRLVQTWPTSLEQLPPMMDYDLRHGRTYLYSKQQPLYAFGYGLSYSTFKYSKVSLSRNQIKTGETLLVKVEVTNQGKMTGDEVLQVYIQHVGSTVDRPIKELKAFQRVTIDAGQKAAVEIPLKVDSLAWWNPRQHRMSWKATAFESWWVDLLTPWAQGRRCKSQPACRSARSNEPLALPTSRLGQNPGPSAVASLLQFLGFCRNPVPDSLLEQSSPSMIGGVSSNGRQDKSVLVAKGRVIRPVIRLSPELHNNRIYSSRVRTSSRLLRHGPQRSRAHAPRPSGDDS